MKTCDDNYLGSRARIGVIVPSSMIFLEPWLHKVAPEGVTFLAARMRIEEPITPETLLTMENYSLQAAADLASAEVDLNAYCCTSGSFVKGFGYDREIIEKLEGHTRIPCTTTSTAVIKALQVLGLKKLVVVTPYPPEVDRIEKQFLEDSGFEVLTIRGMNIKRGPELPNPTPGAIYRFAREIWNSDADGLFISCMAMRAPDAIEPLEASIGKPVLTSAQATLWQVLRSTGVNDRLPLGTLLSRF